MACANAMLQHRRRISRDSDSSIQNSPSGSTESMNESATLLSGPIGMCY